MKIQEIAGIRLANQLIASLGNGARSPEEALALMGAMQAQDYPAALWAIGLRCKDCTRSDVEDAIAKNKIARSWLMRGTLHFAASVDMHWMLNLFRPRLISTAIARDRRLGLGDDTVEKAEGLFRESLSPNRQLTRTEMYRVLEKGNIRFTSQLGYHMLYRAAWDGVICFGPHDGKQPTFRLLDKWITKRRNLSNDQSLAELASRYFTSHGPATIKDYVWWSGLKVSDAKIGIEKASPKLSQEEMDGRTYYLPSKTPKPADDQVHLLPAFDEYIVSYSDRSAMLGNPNTQKMLKSGKITFVHSNGVFLPTIISQGQVIGTWGRSNRKEKVEVTIKPFVKLSKDQIKGIKDASQRYGEFLEIPVVLK